MYLSYNLPNLPVSVKRLLKKLCSLNVSKAVVAKRPYSQYNQPPMSEQTSRRWLALILSVFTLLGVTYALTTPPFEASDELWHYPMIRHLADGNPLPVQVFDPAQAGPWNQEASQPPLYYYLGAALTFWIDTSDMEQVRWLNPHVDTGVLTKDGNINLAIHPPDANPWQGTLLAIYIVRLFSVLLGLATVYLTFRIAILVVSADLTGFQNLSGLPLALGATAVTAFLPMFIFISGAVNNDNLVIPLVALALLLLIWAVKEGPVVNQKDLRSSALISVPLSYKLPWGNTAVSETTYWLILGAVIGLAALTKISGVGLLALAWGTLVVTRWQAWQVADKNNELITSAVVGGWLVQATLRFLLLLLPVLLIAGWWYWRNVQLYGDWTGWNAFIAVLGQRAQPASLAQLWGERWGFMLSYWGLFGGVNVPMPTWIYRLLNGVAIISFVGLLAHLVRLIWRWSHTLRTTHYALRPNLFHTAVSHIFRFSQHHFGLVVCLLWVAATVIGLVQWATTTWSSQGRLVFSALPAISILMIVGLVGWLPPRPARWTLAGLGGFMFLIAALAPFLWIRPAYQPPTATPALAHTVHYNFNDQIRLTGYEIEAADEAGTLQPGHAVWVHLAWEVLAPMERNWSLFLHLNDPILQRPIAQRDMYLGRGLLATSFLEPGQRIVDSYYLEIPATTIAPADLEVTVGLYDFYTWERLPLTTGGDTAELTTLSLSPVAGDYPNPVDFNFENRLRLRGFEVTPRLAAPGETVTLTLYWEGIRPLSQNYTIFAQIVDDDTTRWASHDPEPEPPTSAWQPGQVQTMTMQLTLDEATPAELYPLIIGAYILTDAGEFVRLQLVTPDGRLTDNFLQLTQIRVD
jgi:4-amino-4-deoxy-L-arabinose transferase-like glycosyltransferase